MCPCLPNPTRRSVKETWVMVGTESISSREQIILRKTVNICFVTWPPLSLAMSAWPQRGWAPFTFSMRASGSTSKWVTASVISSFFFFQKAEKNKNKPWRDEGRYWGALNVSWSISKRNKSVDSLYIRLLLSEAKWSLIGHWWHLWLVSHEIVSAEISL